MSDSYVRISPANGVAAFISTLSRDLREASVEFHSVLQSRDGRSAALEYTLSGLWSGRLPSMVVAVYDKPLRLRCIDMLRLEADGASETARVVESRVLLDRFDFLVQIGMAPAKL